jgi:hypothetical protein
MCLDVDPGVEIAYREIVRQMIKRPSLEEFKWLEDRYSTA